MHVRKRPVVSASNLAVAVGARQPKPTPSPGRLQSVDALRGVMILMALDHVRDFMSSAAMQFQPTDLTRTTTALFFTRWITHFCAPVFAFTAGTGAFLWMKRDRTTGQLSRFLLTRGLWLMVLELTVLRWILFLQFGWTNQLIILSVIWMLGLAMVVMAALVQLPSRLLLVLSLSTIATHNLFDSPGAMQPGAATPLWDILHRLAVFPFHGANILVAYPLIPWVAVMAAGYCFGPVLRWEPARRERFLVRLGLALSIAFVMVRAVNRYGDPAPWPAQHSTWFTVLSFLNCTKYPPSLQFLLMTMGPALVVLAVLERMHFSEVNPLIVFGRVPLFYFVVHLAVIHALAILVGFLRYGWHGFLLTPAPSMGGAAEAFPANYGISLPAVYGMWIAVVVVLYPVCRWYADLKARRRDWWLSYL